MTKQTKHTPTPWKVVKHSNFNLFDSTDHHTFAIELGGGSKVALLGDNQEANAAFIVKAVNAHEELLDTLYIVKCSLEAFDQTDSMKRIINNIKQALARAEGE